MNGQAGYSSADIRARPAARNTEAAWVIGGGIWGGGEKALRRCVPGSAADPGQQVTNYFCGPATVTEMLAQMHVTVHQRRAARELGTTQNGTDWSDSAGYPVPEVLNKNQRINDYVAVGLPWVPTRSQLRTYESDLVADINHGRGAPLAGDAYEVPGGPHLVGHPAGSTIFHWFDIRGYQNYGATTDYEDSVHGASSIGWGAFRHAFRQPVTAVGGALGGTLPDTGG